MVKRGICLDIDILIFFRTINLLHERMDRMEEEFK